MINPMCIHKLGSYPQANYVRRDYSKMAFTEEKSGPTYVKQSITEIDRGTTI